MRGRKDLHQRHLPHWQPPGATFFITWRLYESLPQSALEQIEEQKRRLQQEELQWQGTEEERKAIHFKKLFAVYDGLLDQAEGRDLWLRNEAIASIIENSLLHRYAEMYELWAYVVMPNHVHTFLRPQPENTEIDDSEIHYIKLEKITQRLKGYSALEANKILGRTGRSFWQDESYDHWARDEKEFYRIISYIENNPVKAGLASKPEDWRWSSAAERKRRGYTEVKPLT